MYQPSIRIEAGNLVRLISEPAPSRRRRTALAAKRRHLRLMRQIAADLGFTSLTLAQRGLLATAATLVLRIEQFQASVERGELADNDQLIRLSSELRRVARLLGIAFKVEPSPHVPWWRRPVEEELDGAAE